MTIKEKTWSQLEGEIAETFRKWHMDPPRLIYTVSKRSAAKRIQSEDERTVTVEFRYFVNRMGWKDIRLTVKRAERAIDNLALIATALEMMRLARVRNVTDLLVLLYRQTAPAPESAPPPRAEVPPSSGPYAVLHVARAAPLAVCEAAYRALAKAAHPDQGGSTAVMQRLNAAIEAIRREKGA